MAAIIAIILSVLALIIIFLQKKKFIFYVMIYNAVIDSLSFYFEGGGIISIIRGSILFIFSFYVLLTKDKKEIRSNKYIYFYICYILFFVFFSSNIQLSIRMFSKIVISILYFIVGYHCINEKIDLKRMNKSILITMVIYCINAILSTLFHIGAEQKYADEQFLYSGALGGSTYNVLTYGLLLYPLIIYYYKSAHKIKFFIKIIMFLSLIILILNLTRTPIIALIFGYIIFFLKTKYHKKKLISIIILLSILVLVLYPRYGDFFMEQFRIREDRFQELEEEGRYVETKLVWESVFSFESIWDSFLGKELFNSAGHWRYWHDKRMIHVDYNALLHGSGIIGLILYFFIFYNIFQDFRRYKKDAIKNRYTDLMETIFYVFWITQFIISLSGQMYVITFRSINFIYLGGIISVFRNVKKNNFL